MTAPAHDAEAGYSPEQAHRLQPGMIRPTHDIPLCCSPRMGLYREPNRPVPWVVAVAVVVLAAIAIRVVA